jgi:hypothetical protein
MSKIKLFVNSNGVEFELKKNYVELLSWVSSWKQIEPNESNQTVREL